jgi:hypothetical protein
MIAWGGMLRLAVRDYGLTPADFWRLSLREWLLLTAPDHSSLDAANFHKLLQQFPDDISCPDPQLQVPPTPVP